MQRAGLSMSFFTSDSNDTGFCAQKIDTCGPDRFNKAGDWLRNGPDVLRSNGSARRPAAVAPDDAIKVPTQKSNHFNH